jgi:hypothetical protein
MVTPRERGVPPVDNREPWWASDPDLAAGRQAVLAELERAKGEPIRPNTPDPVLADVLSGASVRELSAAGDALACAQARYANAVHTARADGGAVSTYFAGRLLA